MRSDLTGKVLVIYSNTLGAEKRKHQWSEPPGKLDWETNTWRDYSQIRNWRKFPNKGDRKQGHLSRSQGSKCCWPQPTNNTVPEDYPTCPRFPPNAHAHEQPPTRPHPHSHPKNIHCLPSGNRQGFLWVKSPQIFWCIKLNQTPLVI